MTVPDPPLRRTRCAALTLALFAAIAAPAALGTVAAAQPAGTGPATVTTTPFRTPDTDACPNRSVPPPAIDLSEVPAPGETAPAPLPVPSDPVGGGRLDRCGVVTADGTPPLPADISATGWVLADLDTGEVLAAKDPHGRYRPASTIKILLALVALDELDLDTSITASAADADVEGSSVGLGEGGVYTNRQLLQGLVMVSGNDAAHALAAQLGGDAETVRQMNELAARLGALDTRAATPSGLDGPGMSTSAYDLALFYREAMRNPTFAELIHTPTVEFPGHPADPDEPEATASPPYPITNDNKLLHDYPGALGGKTGYTDDARQTFVAGAERDGRRLVVTLVKADVLPIRPWEQAVRLLDYGFALPESTSVGELVGSDTAGGDTAGNDTAGGSGAEVTVAVPPAGASPVSAAGVATGAADDEQVSSVTVVAIGGALIAALVAGAAFAQGRRRR